MADAYGSRRMDGGAHHDNSDNRRADVSGERRDHDSRDAHETAGGTQSRKEVVDREKEEHGGIKIGAAFFGWLTATGMTVLLTAVAAAAGAAVGAATGTTVGDARSASPSSVDTVGITGGIILLVVLFVAYYCGGYVAGRMARFNGLKQGLMVWIWAIVIALIVAAVGAVAGSQYDVLSTLNSFPRLPVGQGQLGLAGIIALAVVVVASLVGALLGGLAGMRYHRKIDKTGLGR